MADYTDIDKLRELMESEATTALEMLAEAVPKIPALLAELVGLRTEVDQLREQNEQLIAVVKFDNSADLLSDALADVRAERDAALAEVDQLRTDNERLTACCNAHQRDVDEWAAEQAEASRKSLALMDDIADLRERLEVSANLSTYPAAEAMNQAERIAQYLESEGLAVRVPVVDDALLAERDALQAKLDNLAHYNANLLDALSVARDDASDGWATAVDEQAQVAALQARIDAAEVARAALATLVRLKDGPRDEWYEDEKPRAWATARAALGVDPQTPENGDQQ